MPLAPDVPPPTDDAAPVDVTTVTIGGGGGGGGAGSVVSSSSVSQSPAVPAVPGAPSWLTGEFYAAIAPGAAAVVGAVTGHHVVPDDIERQLVAFGTVAVMVFTFGRLMLKAAHVHGVASVARAQALAAAQTARSTPAPQINLDAVAAVAARHANADPAAIAAALADEIDRRFVLRARRTPRKARR